MQISAKSTKAVFEHIEIISSSFELRTAWCRLCPGNSRAVLTPIAATYRSVYTKPPRSHC